MEVEYYALIISGIAALFSGMSLIISIKYHKKQEKVFVAQKTTDVLLRLHKIRWFFYELSESILKEKEKKVEKKDKIIFNDLTSLLDFVTKNKNFDESKIGIKLTNKLFKDLFKTFDKLYEKIEELAPKSKVDEIESLLPELNVIEHVLPTFRKLIQNNDA